MNTLPAYDEITLEHGPHAVTLHPSLRAATHLERLHGGFPALVQKVEQFDTRTVRTIIATSATTPQAAQAFLTHAANLPLVQFRRATQAPCIALVAALLPQPKAPAPAASTGTPQPWQQVFRDLFGLATGWLCWTPETAWNATPQEITDAFAAHIEKLKAIHGAADDEATTAPATYTPEHLRQIEREGQDPAFDRAGLHALKGKGKFA